MERGSTAYTQSDNTSAAQYPPQHQDVRSNQYSTTATPTSEYGAAYPPSSARSANFDHLHRAHYSSNNSNSSGGMAQPTNPSIAASSPTYPPYNQQHATYSAQDQMHHPYPPTHSGGSMYSQPRPNWHGYADPSAPNPNVANHPNHPNVANHPAGMVPAPYTSASPQAQSLPASAGRPSQIYSFVPIPGSSQQKRPRRRFEEIERMYKCGHQGCEKAYGTLNHLNAHVTMQSHGNKRTPEEFKEIRKEWKARKKEEEQQRKEQEVARAGGAPAVPEAHPEAGSAAYSRSTVQLPPISNPIGYQPGAQVPNQYQQSQAPASSVQHLQGYGNGQPNMDHYTGYPASPYGSSNHMYSHQSNPAQTKYEH
ncbi:putative con7 regulator protein [Botrytis cinerea BcDW1]|uniref:Putative con7 regulator protein n=1 Tax=Botryotinia fuckeliana (strain BcDW1) TaxID=1290391 RepID=M7TVQ0_BOTF1|nr:putative con7 regulator protein [Botrytis cinerea BcDW1]